MPQSRQPSCLDSYAAPDAQRPEIDFGTIDWERFFEDGRVGVIPLMSQARSLDTLKECSVLVVESLFIRDEDAPRRKALLRVIHDLLEPGARQPEDGLDAVKQRLSTVFRFIKDDRKVRAETYIAIRREEMEEGEEPHLRLSEPEAPPLVEEDLPHVEPTPEDHHDAEALFCRVFWEIVKERLDALQSGMPGKVAVAPVPFMLSPAFTEHFAQVMLKGILPGLAARTNSLVSGAERIAPEARREWLHRAMDDRRNRRGLWETWKTVWRESTCQQEIPAKPKAEKKKTLESLIQGLKKDKTPTWRKKMTIEEWEKLAPEIKAANRQAARVWRDIAAPSDVYSPPTEDDNEFLMGLFGRSPGVIKEQIGALRQISTQGGNIGNAFDMYQKGKNLDLPLLAASLWYPESFLGKNGMLKIVAASYPKGSLAAFLPFTARYLKDYLPPQ